jgi:predicted metalloprotease with PDZ domain
MHGSAYALLILAALTLPACTPSTILVNDSNQVIRCSAYGWGIAGVATAYGIRNSCVADYKKLGYVELPDVQLGVGIQTVDSSLLRITRVPPQSPAAVAGLAKGDIIATIDGRPIETLTEFYTYLATKRAGDVVSCVVTRDGQRVQTQVTLQAR